MTTPRDLLVILNELAERVAERQLNETDAIASLKHELRKYPEVRDKWTEERATAELDKRVKRQEAKRNSKANAEIARKLAELGLERPTLTGDVIPISQDDPKYAKPLADELEFLGVNIGSTRRLLKGFEDRQANAFVLLAAVGGDRSVSAEHAVNALKRMPEARRKALRAEVETSLREERRAWFDGRYGKNGRAAEG